MSMGRVSIVAMAALLASGAAPAQAEPAPVRAAVVFGDSISDVGTYAPATGNAADPGRFTSTRARSGYRASRADTV